MFFLFIILLVDYLDILIELYENANTWLFLIYKNGDLICNLIIIGYKTWYCSKNLQPNPTTSPVTWN